MLEDTSAVKNTAGLQEEEPGERNCDFTSAGENSSRMDVHNIPNVESQVITELQSEEWSAGDKGKGRDKCCSNRSSSGRCAWVCLGTKTIQTEIIS